MPKFRRLSGAEVVAILGRFGFTVVSQQGSHMKLRRTRVTGKQVLTVPAHPTIDPGTLRAIFRRATRFISEEELYPHFYQ